MKIEENVVLLFKDIRAIEYLVKLNPDIQFIEIDPESTRIRCYFEIFKGKRKEALIQIEEKSEDNFYFRPSVDGGVVLINKAQTELSI